MPRRTSSKIIASLIRRLRQFAWRALGPAPTSSQDYVGPYGCIRCAASFLAWNQVDGDYLEFGVYRGRSFAEAFHAIWSARNNVRGFVDSANIEEWYERRPRFIAFDSFEGLPGGNVDRHVDYGEGAYCCSEADFLKNIEDAGVDANDVATIPGFFDQSLTPEVKRRLNLKRASLVMIDCDLYESTVPVLEFITDMVDQGTIIIFDDWYRFKGSPDSGEQRACREWLEKNPQLQLTKYWQQGPHAVAFLVNRLDDDTSS